MIKRNKKLPTGLPDNQRPIFIDPHMVSLLSHLQPTDHSSLLCAIVFQKISWIIHRQKKAKSIKTSVPALHKAHFAYMSERRVREAIRMLHEVGVLKIETSLGAHDSKFYLDRGRVVELAKMVQEKYEIEVQE